MTKCFIWKMNNKNRVPELVFTTNSVKLFKEEIENCLNDEKNTYGFRIERYEE